MRPSMVSIVRGWGGTEPCQGVPGVVWAHAGGRARLGRVLVGRGGSGAGTHAGCSTVGRPAELRQMRAGEGALVQGGRLGVPQGGKWQLQDMLVAGFWCWFAKWPWWWPCPWHGCLGLGFRAWGVWLLSRTCRGALGVLLDKLV